MFERSIETIQSQQSLDSAAWAFEDVYSQIFEHAVRSQNFDAVELSLSFISAHSHQVSATGLNEHRRELVTQLSDDLLRQNLTMMDGILRLR